MRFASTTAGAVRHVLLAGAEGLLVAAIIAALVILLAPVYTGAGTLAGKSSAGSAASSIEFVGTGATARSVASYGDTVTTSSRLARDYYLVYVRLMCRQSGSVVMEKWVNIKTGDWTTGGRASFTLAGQNWDGGGASCQADLLNAVVRGGKRTYKTLASADLAVGG
jgi:hypothetical protein